MRFLSQTLRKARDIVSDPVGDVTSDTIQSAIEELSVNKINITQKGANNGIATLDDNGKVPKVQIPFETDAQSILDLIKTVDGTGSGLDADLLDGMGSFDFVFVSNISDSVTSTSSDIVSSSKATKTAMDKADVASGKADVASGKADVASGKADVASGKADVASGKADVASGKADAASGKADAASGKADAASDKADAASGKADAASGKADTAIYPYSGVIGSVDKEDLILFQTTNIIYANKFWVKAGTEFNIAGRLVGPGTSHITVILPEAESTGDRAIAFDDIFLDWNGNVTSYRSIAPHRTATGFDRDLISTEHGYVKIQTGLYKIGDTYALLLGRVARRNQGAYHPVFNADGSTAWMNINTGKNSVPWSFDSSGDSKTKITAFTLLSDGTTGTTGAREKGGDIKLGTGYLGNPHDKFYDAIYPDDFTPLYYSAKNVIDRQALLFDSFNRAVAGETFSGAEGLINSGTLRISSITVSDKTYISTGDHALNTPVGNAGIIFRLNGSLFKTVEHNTVYWFAVYKYVDGHFINGDFSSDFNIPDGGYLYAQIISINDSSSLFEHKPYLSLDYNSARPKFLTVDIIGSPDAMPDEWEAEGVPGNWLAVGEDGESLIPDGTEKNFKLSRRCLDCFQVLSSNDKGITWNDHTTTWESAFESPENSRKSSLSSSWCIMVFYITAANPFEFSDNTDKCAIVDPVYIGNYSTSLFASNLINKIPTSTFDTEFRSKQVDSLSITHNSIDGLVTTNPSMKAVAYLSHIGMNIIYKEMKHNGTQWGDDNKFDIVDKKIMVTDLNGESVIVGQKRVELPYHFDGVIY